MTIAVLSDSIIGQILQLLATCDRLVMLREVRYCWIEGEKTLVGAIHELPLPGFSAIFYLVSHPSIQ